MLILACRCLTGRLPVLLLLRPSQLLRASACSSWHCGRFVARPSSGCGDDGGNRLLYGCTRERRSNPPFCSITERKTTERAETRPAAWCLLHCADTPAEQLGAAVHPRLDRGPEHWRWRRPRRQPVHLSQAITNWPREEDAFCERATPAAGQRAARRRSRVAGSRPVSPQPSRAAAERPRVLQPTLTGVLYTGHG